MKKYFKNANRGFSLVEVVVVVAIGAAVLFVIISLQGNVAVLENIVSQKLQSRQDLEQTFQILVTEIRSASPSSNGAYAIESATTSSFAFFSDIDRDGIFERTRYFLSSSTIWRGVVEPTGSPLVYVTSTEIVTKAVENVVNTSSTVFLEYFGENYTGSEAVLSSPIDVQQIRVVKVSIYADVAPGEAPKPAFFTNTITIRNLRSN